MHVTQRDVIAKLMYADELRYSEIKPADMSGNQFAYHLDKLIAQKLVEKNLNGFYSLTIKGMELTDRLTYKTMKTTRQPKLAVALYMKDSNGRVLLQRRGRQPYPNTWLLPASRIRMGEQPMDAVERVIGDRMESDLRELEFMTTISVQFARQENRFINDLLYMIFTPKGKQTYVPNSERYVFSDLSEQENLFPSTQQVVEAAEKPGSLHQLTIQLDPN